MLFGSRNNQIENNGKNVYDQSYGRPMSVVGTRRMILSGHECGLA